MNLFVEGIDIRRSKDKTIRIGNDIVLKITGETKPCYRMDEQVKGLTQALVTDWKAGVCCKVINGGNIKVGDKLSLEAPNNNI